jgi:hypothetical protein
MINDKYMWELQRTLSAEFSKYILAHPELDSQIPNNAQVIFQIKGNDEFNAWSEKTNLAQREPNQPVVVVEIDDLAAPLESRLVNPHLVENTCK